MFQTTSNMLMQNGIMPYDLNAYLFGVNNPNMGYIPAQPMMAQPLYFPPMGSPNQDVLVQDKKPKKHILSKITALAVAALGISFLLKKPSKVKDAGDTVVEKTKSGVDYIKENALKAYNNLKPKVSKAYNTTKEAVQKFFSDAWTGAKELYKKIFHKG